MYEYVFFKQGSSKTKSVGKLCIWKSVKERQRVVSTKSYIRKGFEVWSTG